MKIPCGRSLGLISAIICTSCGYIVPNGQPTSGDLVYFTSGSASAPLNVYGLDTKNFALAPISVSSQNQDMVLFYDNSHSQYYTVKRLDSRNSSVLTKFSLTNSTEWERGNLPVNVSGLLTSENGKFITAFGNQNGDLQVLSNSGVLDSQPVSLSLTNKEVPLEDLRFVGGAYSNAGDLFAVSAGLTDSYQPTQAKIHKLSKDSASILKTLDISNCKNISDLPTGFKPISRSAFLVVCNPQYLKQVNGTISIVEVDVASGEPISKVIKTTTSADGVIKGYSVKGVSPDKKWIFVEDLADVSMLVVSRSYWLNIDSGIEKEIKNYGGSFFFDKTTSMYLFGCSKNGSSRCKDKTFALVEEKRILEDMVAAEKAVNYENKFTGFANMFY